VLGAGPGSGAGTGFLAGVRIRLATRAWTRGRPALVSTRCTGLRFGSVTIKGPIVSELFGVVWAMAGAAAAEESNASKLSGVTFERNQRGAAYDHASARIGAERRQF